MRNIFLILVLCTSFYLSFSQPKTLTPVAKPEEAGLSSERLARIDKMVEEHVSNQWVPGAVVLIVRNGKIAYHKAYGYKDAESKTPLKKDDIFRIASQTKAITSLAAMILWEEGKFLLDDPISKYIPEFKNPTVLKTFNPKDSSYTTEPAKSEITVRQLLTHSSGIDYAAIGSDEFKAIYAKAGVPSGIGNNNMILGEKMRILGKLPLRHQPGEHWTYGLNDDVLGYLVEIWSGMPFDQFLRKRIFDPLGMKDTYFYLPKDKHSRLVTLYAGGKDGKIVKPEVKAYDNVDPNYPNTAGTYFSGGAGLSSTVEDYAKFLQLFLNKGKYNGVQLLSRKTVELMLTDQHITNTHFGLGFGLETVENDYQSVLSLGTFSWGGAFNTHYWADPKENLIGLIFTNIYQTPYWSIGDKFKTLTYQSFAD
ncbi:MAG TPA: serine hydrolase domain-containing protein [Ohtaekwangia sp.]|uniref:serine hydrolase domain-containing protein n=1 Tax=Ohtaekwangia sp. TaxID=2066019 RepID=UPI002F9589A0